MRWGGAGASASGGSRELRLWLAPRWAIKCGGRRDGQSSAPPQPGPPAGEPCTQTPLPCPPAGEPCTQAPLPAAGALPASPAARSVDSLMGSDHLQPQAHRRSGAAPQQSSATPPHANGSTMDQGAFSSVPCCPPPPGRPSSPGQGILSPPRTPPPTHTCPGLQWCPAGTAARPSALKQPWPPPPPSPCRPACRSRAATAGPACSGTAGDHG